MHKSAEGYRIKYSHTISLPEVHEQHLVEAGRVQVEISHMTACPYFLLHFRALGCYGDRRMVG